VHRSTISSARLRTRSLPDASSTVCEGDEAAETLSDPLTAALCTASVAAENDRAEAGAPDVTAMASTNEAAVADASHSR
jgi:hypothetical protein